MREMGGREDHTTNNRMELKAGNRRAQGGAVAP